jgi:uncharacterized protein (DUF1015 family)
VLAPPYDVVGAEDGAALLARSPHNAAHLELAPGPEPERFALAAERLREWVAEGVLRRDEQPAYYVYEQRTAIQGDAQTRRCFFVRLRLHRPEEEVVRPHEATMAGPRAERLNLLRATRTNISPIFAMFRDPTGVARAAVDAVAGGEPVFEARDALGDEHRLWVLEDPEHAETLTAAVGLSKVTIADGHHRYATALDYLAAREADGALPADAPERYVLTGLIAEEERGLVILPNHRLVKGEPPRDFLDRLGGLYEVEAVEGWGDAVVHSLWESVRAQVLGPPAFGIIDLGERRIFFACARSRADIDAAMPEQLSAASKGLDALVLTETILRPLLGIDAAALHEGERVGFTADAGSVLREGERGGYRLAFLLNPTRVPQVSAVADAGELMPQKTTYFYPKLATGLVFNPLD